MCSVGAGCWQRLSGRLKLLVRGGEELYRLCTSSEVDMSSVFHQLARLHVEPFSQREITRLVTDHLGVTDGAASLYDLTHGHPALVYEALESARDALLAEHLEALRERLLTGAYLNHQLEPTIDQTPELLAVLQRLQHGATAKRAAPAEDRLYWLGIIREQDVGHWGWTAPVFRDWAQRWCA